MRKAGEGPFVDDAWKIPAALFENRMRQCRRFQDELDSLLPLEAVALWRRQLGQPWPEPWLESGISGKGPKTFGDFQLLSELGSGGMGIVYEAVQLPLGRRVALKVLRPDCLTDERALARFKREAWVGARINHPSICTVHAAGVWQGVPYIAMRFVEGETLAQKLAASRPATESSIDLASTPFFGPKAAEESLLDSEGSDDSGGPNGNAGSAEEEGKILSLLHYFERAARALHTAHEKGFVHRDIKPSNLMVTPEGDPVIVDFGLARKVKALDSGSAPVAGETQPRDVTRAGELIGTCAYLSPEQVASVYPHPKPHDAACEEDAAIERQSDIFSLGVTMYECLTRRHPFPARTEEGMYRKILYSEPQNPRILNPALSKDLEAVVQKALEKDRSRRYRTALELAEELRRVRHGEPVQARRVGSVTRLWRWRRRHPLEALLILVLAVGFVTCGALWYRGNKALRKLDEANRRLRDTLGTVFSEANRTLQAVQKGEVGSFSPEFRAVLCGRTEELEEIAAGKGRRREVVFAVYTSDDAVTMLDKCDPILLFLEKRLGLRIRMRIYPSYEAARTAFVEGSEGAGKTFTRVGPSSYILARRENPRVTLLAMEERGGETHFLGHIVVRQGSGLTEIGDLRGKRFAFGDPNSTIGRYLAQAFLAAAGLRAEDLDFEYLKNHDAVARAVYNRQFDAGAVKDSTLKAHARKGLVSLASFDNVTKPWVAGPDFDPQLAAEMRRCLLEIQDRDVLQAFAKDLTGFRAPDDEAYNEIRERMEDASAFMSSTPVK